MDMSRVSTCSYPLRERSLDDTIHILTDCGFTNIDLWGRSPHFSVNPQEVKPKDVEATAAKYGARIANLGTYPGRDFANADRQARHTEMMGMTRTIDLATRFGARSIRVLPGESDARDLVKHLVRPFRQSAVYAASKGIYLGMENHAGSIAGNPDLCKRLCVDVDSRFFGVLYEPCNLLHGKVDYREAFETFKDHIVHVHIKDGRWVGDKFERCHLGEGDVDVAWVVEALESIGYTGYYALEYELTDIEPIETGLPKWREYFMKATAHIG